MLRNLGMFTAVDTSLNADAQGQRSLYSAAAMSVKRRVGAQAVSDRTGRQDWIAEIEAIRDQQDQRAFSALFAHFAPRVKAFLMKSGTAPDAAEECAQEVMATLWRKAGMFDGSKASVTTWVFTIARNRRIDMIRRGRRPEPEDLPWGPEADPGPAEVMALQEETERLGRALATLPEPQRKLIERAYFGELSHSEIAAETGLPLGTIKSRIRLALDRLRHAMT
jgi:RNA polymerase sigma factor (sigma-70 family)